MSLKFALCQQTEIATFLCEKFSSISLSDLNSFWSRNYYIVNTIKERINCNIEEHELPKTSNGVTLTKEKFLDASCRYRLLDSGVIVVSEKKGDTVNLVTSNLELIKNLHYNNHMSYTDYCLAVQHIENYNYCYDNVHVIYLTCNEKQPETVKVKCKTLDTTNDKLIYFPFCYYQKLAHIIGDVIKTCITDGQINHYAKTKSFLCVGLELKVNNYTEGMKKFHYIKNNENAHNFSGYDMYSNKIIIVPKVFNRNSCYYIEFSLEDVKSTTIY